MEEIRLAVILGELALIGLLVFIGYKIFQDPRRLQKPMIRKFVSAAVLIIVWALVVLQQPLHLWQRFLATFCAQYGVLLYYCALDQMLNDKKVRPVLRSRVFPITTLIVLIVVILDFQLGDRRPAFGYSNPNTLTSLSNTESALNYFGLLYLDALIVRVYMKDLRRHVDLIYTARRSFCMLGFLVNLIGLLLLEVSLLLSFYVKGGYGPVISSMYILSLILMAALVAGGYLLPDRFFTKVLSPINAHVILRQKQQQELLGHLHQTLIQIVPGVHLDCEQIQDLRAPIEISDARQIIWSHRGHTQPITPEDEAEHLLHLLRINKEFDKPGVYEPAPVREHNIDKHNIAVAKHLKSMQGDSAT